MVRAMDRSESGKDPQSDAGRYQSHRRRLRRGGRAALSPIPLPRTGSDCADERFDDLSGRTGSYRA